MSAGNHQVGGKLCTRTLEVKFFYSQLVREPRTMAKDLVQKNMLRYWVNFARTGNPNQEGLPQWPVYKSGEDCYLEIKATPDASQCGLRTPQSNLWDDVVGFVSDNTAPRTRQPGHWHNEATWTTYRVPDSTSQVVIQHAVTISNHATCKSLRLASGAVAELLAGIKLEVLW